jgi:hypothetical protein
MGGGQEELADHEEQRDRQPRQIQQRPAAAAAGRSETPQSRPADLQTHLAPVLGGGRFMQPGADGGDTRDRTGKSSSRNWRFDQASIVKLSIGVRSGHGASTTPKADDDSDTTHSNLDTTHSNTHHTTASSRYRRRSRHPVQTLKLRHRGYSTRAPFRGAISTGNAHATRNTGSTKQGFFNATRLQRSRHLRFGGKKEGSRPRGQGTRLDTGRDWEPAAERR